MFDGFLPLFSGKPAAKPVLGDLRELLMNQAHGPYASAARRGRLFLATSAQAGIALIVAATTGGHPTLWNPLGSRRVLSIRRLDLSWLSGNNAPTGLEWDSTLNAGSQVATGAPILTATKVAVLNANGGDAVDSKAIWSPTTNTFTAAPAFYYPAGISLFTGIGTTAVAPFVLSQEYGGALRIPPGTALSLCSRAATTTALFQVGIVFEEEDE